MKTTVIQRIKEIIEKRGVTSRGFSSEIDFNYTTLNNCLTGRRKAVSCELIEKILSSFGNISAGWLMLGEGDMLRQNPLAPLQNPCEIEETRPRIPMAVAAGSLSGFAGSVSAYDCERIPIVKAFPNYDYSIIIKGDSMEPRRCQPLRPARLLFLQEYQHRQNIYLIRC